MHKLSVWLLWMVVFSLPSELIVSVDLIGSISRLIGIAAVGVGGLTLLLSGRFRRPSLIICLALAFTFLAFLSIGWTVAYTPTTGRAATYAQLFGFLWLLWEYGRTQEEQRSLMFAYCLGSYVAIGGLLRSFLIGQHFEPGRYTSNNLNPNDFGLTLAIGIPIAWYLFMERRGIVRFFAGAYLPLAVVAILLTASRGAFLAGVVALSIVPLTMPRMSIRSIALVLALIGVSTSAAAWVVPQASWNRILTTGYELSQGTLDGRTNIWEAGVQTVLNHPALGVGAGAFEAAVEPLIGPKNSPHNVFLAVLVEQGLVGFALFIVLLAACGWRIYRMPRLERMVWAVVSFIWFVGAMSLGWQYRKVTWLIFALIAVQAVQASRRSEEADDRDSGRHRRQSPLLPSRGAPHAA